MRLVFDPQYSTYVYAKESSNRASEPESDPGAESADKAARAESSEAPPESRESRSSEAQQAAPPEEYQESSPPPPPLTSTVGTLVDEVV